MGPNVETTSNPGSVVMTTVEPVTNIPIMTQDGVPIELDALIYATVYPVPTITSPASGATGVSVTPTVTSKEGVAAVYTLATRATTDVTGVGVNTDLVFNQSGDADVPLDTTTGIFTLKAGVEYELIGAPNLTTFSAAGAYMYFAWVLAADNSELPNGQSGSIIPSTFSASNAGSQPQAVATYRPTVDTEVKLRTLTGSGTCTFSAANSWATVRTTAIKHLDYTQAASQIQIATSAGTVVYDSGVISALSIASTTTLAASTSYKTRARHRGDSGHWTNWSEWSTFTTA